MGSPYPALTPEDQDDARSEEIEHRELVNTLNGYISEAEEARESGPGAREVAWSLNWNAYWANYDFTEKADWQSQNIMPEVPQFVERFTAAITQALVQAGQWYTITDPAKKLTKIMPLVERVVRIMLDRAGRNQTDHRIGFEKPFGDSIKAGCMSLVAMSVTWQDGALVVEPVDARELFFDPTGRNLYRIRRFEIDRHQLDEWREQLDSQKNPLFDQDAIDRVVGGYSADSEEQIEKERMTGHGQETKWQRRPVEIHECLATILDSEGHAYGPKELAVMANRQEIIRGPEPNPYWHGRDWIIASPLITVPFSMYGRSYVEGFRQIAHAFTELTNLLHDSVFTSNMNCFMAWPSKLRDPNQIDEGVSPNKVFVADEEETDTSEEFIKSVKLGNPQAMQHGVAMWQGLKAELREGGLQNELSLGQIPPKGDITATEIVESKEGSNSLTTHIAGNIESYVLSPLLELAWMTTLQMLDPADEDLRDELGEEVADMLSAQKEDFRKRRFRFKANGLTGIIERARRIRNMLGFLQVATGNERLMALIEKRFSMDKLLDRMMRDFGIDPYELEKSDEEKMQEAIQAARDAGLMARRGPTPGSPAGAPRTGSAPAPRALPGGIPT